MNDLHDVAVIGAGPGGSATAHYLAQRGLKVLLLDKAEFPRDKTCGDGLTPRAVGVLQDMGLVDELKPAGHIIKRFEVFAPNGKSTRDVITVRDGLPDFAMVVPRFRLDECIRNRAVQSGANFIQAQVVDVQRVNSRVEIKIVRAGASSVETAQSRMAVIATGANTRLLMQAGILRQQPKVMVASRAYYENVAGLSDIWTLRFDDVPMPGYGWVFPAGNGLANIGVGYFKERRDTSAAHPFKQFIASKAVSDMLTNAKQVGPVKGYPLRDDFLISPTFADGVLLVGEAAGLVNPLTGEGIDYALESGRIAARRIAGMFNAGDLSQSQFAAYDAELRTHFQSLFEFCIKVRELCLKPFVLNTLVSVANRRTDLRQRLVSVVLGGAPVQGKLTFGRVVKALIRKNKNQEARA
jgi:geranylgeranyl reductase family protein